MSENNLPVKSDFLIMDEADSQQIQDAETAVKQALAYEVKGKKQLSYMGIKWIVLKMSQKEQPIEVIDMPNIELVKHEAENKSTWIWYATIKVRNRKTGLSTIGASESPYLDYNGYDTFGRTKALSKAERNACRKQIPEVEINAMLNSIGDDDVQKLNGTSEMAPPTPMSGPTEQQLETLKSLGWKGPKPESKLTASNIIQDIKSKAKDGDTADEYEKYCVCDDFIPSSISGENCQTCKKLKRKEN